MSLSQSIIEKLGYYVYLLTDPRDKKVFYVGKGKGNRINQHMQGALRDNSKEADKNMKILEIIDSGSDVEYKVLRHGLTEKEALEVESAVIDMFGIKNITNIVSGHNSEDRGIMGLNDIKIKYEAEKINPDSSIMLININNLYSKEMSRDEIYEATRKSWRIDMKRVSEIKIACATYRGNR